MFCALGTMSAMLFFSYEITLRYVKALLFRALKMLIIFGFQ